MNQEICLNASNPDWLENVLRRLQRPLARSERLRLGLLCLANACCSLLVLAPAILFAATAGGALHFSQQLNGPLDWFLFELLGGAAVLFGILAVDLLFTRPSSDQGIPVTRAQSPELFAMLERRLSGFRIRNIEQVSLTDDTRLRIDACPHWLLPLAHRRQLQTGAALLFFLSPAQFRLALAASVAAHATTRRSLRGWLARSHRDWQLIFRAVDGRRSISSRFLRRPLAHMTALLALLGRELENYDLQMQYRWLRDNTDEGSAADLLAARTVAASFLERQYWPMILEAADRCPQPVVHPFGHFGLLLQRTLGDADARRWLLGAQSGSSNHCDLLAELGVEHLRWNGIPSTNAFDLLFGSTDILKQLDEYWRRRIAAEWKQRHDQAEEKHLRFDRLHRLALNGSLRGDPALRYIKLAADMLDRDQAITAWQAILMANFSDARVCMACGRSLLAADAVAEGREALERAVQLDPALEPRIRQLLVQRMPAKAAQQR